jgi:nitrogenase molybdenum-iron protein alpha/beta subunit
VKAPQIVSSGLQENEIIFGGEAALERAISGAAALNPSCIFVLSTCIAETIGDDVGAACHVDRGIPIIQVPTGGFLGGVFDQGVNNALCAIADTAHPATRDGTVNIIGEKNLEFEVEENHAELVRLLDALGLRSISGLCTIYPLMMSRCWGRRRSISCVTSSTQKVSRTIPFSQV